MLTMKYLGHIFEKLILELLIWKVLRIQSSFFNKHGPIKRDHGHASEALLMTKELYNVIMKRSKVRNNFLESKAFSDRNVSKPSYCKNY